MLAERESRYRFDINVIRNRMYLNNKKVDISNQCSRNIDLIKIWLEQGREQLDWYDCKKMEGQEKQIVDLMRKGKSTTFCLGDLGGRAQRLPPMAVGDKTNRLYLNEKNVDTSRQSWRKQMHFVPSFVPSFAPSFLPSFLPSVEANIFFWG